MSTDSKKISQIQRGGLQIKKNLMIWSSSSMRVASLRVASLRVTAQEPQVIVVYILARMHSIGSCRHACSWGYY